MNINSKIKTILSPIITLLAIIILWKIAVIFWNIPKYLLPTPDEVFHTYINNASFAINSIFATLKIILSGFTISLIIAIPCGYIISKYNSGAFILYPLLLIVQLTPKTILAPLLLIYLGIGFVPKSTLVFLMTFFPILIESIAGFKNIDKRLYYITNSMGASTKQSFFYIEMPAAMTHIFAGMKTAMVYAITAAIVAEYIGSNEGVGYLILIAAGGLDMPLMFVGVVAASALGIALSIAMMFLERVCLPWHDHD